jgi:hypothetical protein
MGLPLIVSSINRDSAPFMDLYTGTIMGLLLAYGIFSCIAGGDCQVLSHSDDEEFLKRYKYIFKVAQRITILIIVLMYILGL